MSKKQMASWLKKFGRISPEKIKRLSPAKLAEERLRIMGAVWDQCTALAYRTWMDPESGFRRHYFEFFINGEHKYVAFEEDPRGVLLDGSVRQEFVHGAFTAVHRHLKAKHN